MNGKLPGDIARRIKATARRLDRIYCGGLGNEAAAIENELLNVALKAQTDFNDGRCA